MLCSVAAPAAILAMPLRAAARRLSVRIALVALATVAVFWSAFAPTASASSNDDFFGVNPGDLFKLPQSQWDAHLGAMAADGIQVVRMGAWWSDIEPAPMVGGQHKYAWGDVDERVAAMAQHGLRWEPLLCFSPTWDSTVLGDYTAAPASSQHFADFAAALAQRYGNGGSFWREHPELPAMPVTAYELWNEQNAPVFWHPGENAAEQYADLYAAARSSIHQVDGGARVVVGGLAATTDHVVPADQFIERMFAHRPDLRGNVDAVGFHPYARDPNGVYAKLADFRRALDATAGPGVPIEVTEIGWTTSNTSEQQRAAYLGTIASTLPRSDCGIERLMAYAWIGPELASADREQWFGIRNHDASPRPSSTAYANAIKQMRGISGAPPSDVVHICGSADAPDRAPTTPSTTRAATPKLTVQLRVKQNRNRLNLFARCPVACSVRGAVLVPRRRATASTSSVRTAWRSSQSAARHHVLSLKVSRRLVRPGTRVRVKVIAADRNGHRTARSTTVRLR